MRRHPLNLKATLSHENLEKGCSMWLTIDKDVYILVLLGLQLCLAIKDCTRALLFTPGNCLNQLNFCLFRRASRHIAEWMQNRQILYPI